MARKNVHRPQGTIVIVEHRLARPRRQSARRPAHPQARRLAAAAVRRRRGARQVARAAASAIRCSTTSSASPVRGSRTSTGARSTRTSPSARARLIAEQRMGPCIVVFPDCFTCLGGNQYINSTAIGRYADYLTREIVPLRRPRVPHARVARSPRLLRQVVGRLWRDHPRHEVREALGRDRRSLRRRVLRILLPARTGRAR